MKKDYRLITDAELQIEALIALGCEITATGEHIDQITFDPAIISMNDVKQIIKKDIKEKEKP